MPPLRYDRLGDAARALVWAGSESSEILAGGLPPTWAHHLPRHEQRARETLAARRALLALEPGLERLALRKSPEGKPFVNARPTVHFSLSHSHGQGAALVSPRTCGVDLQLRVEKIGRLRSRFERADEGAFVREQADELGALHVLWGAKESLYKLWGLRGVDWVEHLRVERFEHTAAGGTFTARVVVAQRQILADGYYRWVGDFCLVATVARPTGAQDPALVRSN